MLYNTRPHIYQKVPYYTKLGPYYITFYNRKSRARSWIFSRHFPRFKTHRKPCSALWAGTKCWRNGSSITSNEWSKELSTWRYPTVHQQQKYWTIRATGNSCTLYFPFLFEYVTTTTISPNTPYPAIKVFPQFWCLSFLIRILFQFIILYRKLLNPGVVINGSFRDRFDNLLIDFADQLF